MFLYDFFLSESSGRFVFWSQVARALPSTCTSWPSSIPVITVPEDFGPGTSTLHDKAHFTHDQGPDIDSVVSAAHTTTVCSQESPTRSDPDRVALFADLRRRLQVVKSHTVPSVTSQPWWRWVRQDSLPKNVPPPVAPVLSTLEQRAICPALDRDRLAPQRGCIDEVRQLKKGDLYIGRGARQLGLEKSKWCNPYRVRDHGRRQALILFREHLKATPDMVAFISELQGKRLLCHCKASEECHADALIEAFLAEFPGSYVIGKSEDPPSQAVALAAAEAREELDIFSDTEPDAFALPGGAGWVGNGDPLTVGRAGKHRGLQDGAVLCSSERDPMSQLTKLGADFADREGDRVENTPFYRLFGALSHIAGDPDALNIAAFANGVPIGVGGKLPRQPALYRRKRKWRLKEQKTAVPEVTAHGEVWMSNYKSAHAVPGAHRKAIDKDVAIGRMIRGDRLRIAALGAMIGCARGSRHSSTSRRYPGSSR